MKPLLSNNQINIRYQFKIMIVNRGKQSKSETPTRHIQPLTRITPVLANAKKSDPFLRELKEVYDKQNIHPNLKENRTRSYHTKPDDNRSPVKKVMNLKQLHKNPPQAKPNEALNSHSKYNQSSELQRMAAKSRGSNRQSTEKDQLHPSHLQDEYFPSKEEKREKKMKVTLKDLKKHRKSMHESEGEYLGKTNGDTRESISQDSLGKLDTNKAQLVKNQNQREDITIHSFEPELKLENKPQEHFCINHPEKRATHQLIDSGSEQSFCEKCAVGLATKGYQMSQLNSNHHNQNTNIHQLEVREERIGELKDFLFQLDKMEPLFKRSVRRITSYKCFLANKFEEEGRKLDIYYNNLCTVVKNSYDSARSALKIHYDALLEEVDHNISTVQARGEQISNLKEDILPNISSIIEVGQVSSESFRSVINYNYKRLSEIEGLMKQLSGNSCNYYQYRFENVEELLVDLRSLISPALQTELFDCSFETQRKQTQSCEEKWFDPFRMSFGKHGSAAYRF